ncbi:MULTISPECIES: alpha/beta fold hydrolase [Streptomycetaceae]|uniref:Proline aminopeptidase n=1 Tax=Streptantibioticus cattleyicolor (strain ATCC 35852 / DSM 46488 / JCM 4925 / NBRC 14057 / NRRL 8057) TaxID=1003195 RepID=F8JVP6_STREN|nr:MULTISPECIES: alpha/beta fold hydrolase [Streptomycetaceae]AEW96956.1 proline aminopeptidase [Streptantibioticus cattleyicolor NRRL 8057 = DSM 46488]MYS61428.1 alpha/beta fold hydrolase [Streptomyces sp. SID5468]CCB77283.1 Proline iminopeptidase [Streptantibioticus cattleyicolor NRRL 8057 = DSM 46488]
MAVHRQPGTVLTDHVFSVPLDHSDPGGERIEVYAREVVAAGREKDSLPWLLFLQGGPGGSSPRPLGKDGWLVRALDDYRVLLLDQRGTGRSTPVNRQTLPRRGDAAAQADHLSHFRADSIVADCELIRRQLLGEDAKWSLLGQSFGGFCTLTYLSFAPEGLREAFVTGGLAGLGVSARDVYRSAYPRVERKNDGHYRRYPEDVEAVRKITRHLAEREVRLPDGGLLTVPAFQSLGMMLGSSTGSHTLHYLLEDAFLPGPGDAALSDSFLHQAQQHLSFAQRPLYAVLHEAIYGQRSVSRAATGWAAQSVRDEFPRFDADRALSAGEPVLFTGEMIYPWMFETDPALVPLRGVAEELAARGDWPDLYDADRLARNEVPVAAAVYHDDMYVDTADSLATARAVNSLRTWVTDEYEHDGLRASGGRVLDRLIRMVRGEV